MDNNKLKLNLQPVTVTLTAPVAVVAYLVDTCNDQIGFWNGLQADNDSFSAKTSRAMTRGYEEVASQLAQWEDNNQELVEDEGIVCRVCGCQDVDVILVSCMNPKHTAHRGSWLLTIDGFAWDDKLTHRDSSTTDEVAECTRCYHRGPLQDFNFGSRT